MAHDGGPWRFNKKPRAEGPYVVASGRLVRPTILLGAALAVTIADACGGLVRAQGRLDARYSATLGGLPFGRGVFQIEVGDGQFSAVVSGGTAGLMRVFTKGQGTSAVRGTVSGGQPSAQTYASTIVTDK